mgnify:CR=1 FL=1
MDIKDITDINLCSFMSYVLVSFPLATVYCSEGKGLSLVEEGEDEERSYLDQ